MSDHRPLGGLVGEVLELDVGAPAHGGACVARYTDPAGDPGADGAGSNEGGGRVVFVRHALPGERVRALVTEDRGGPFLRADAIDIVQASPERVVPPCEYAGPGRCGGCDWQHASATAQRALKAAVVRDQFARLGSIELGELLGEVEPLPGGLLGWRTRITYAVDPHGAPGLHRHGSHDVEHVRRCLLGMPGVGDSSVLDRTWPGCNGVEVVRGDDGDCSELTHRPAPAGKPGGRRPRRAHGRRPPDRVALSAGPAQVRRAVGDRTFTVAAGGFWQVHPAAAQHHAVAIRAALAGTGDLTGSTVLDLYAGAGALTAALAEAVGGTGRTVGLESDATAVASAAANLADLPHAEVRHGRVTAASVAELGTELATGGGVDLVVLDPPRAGAGADVIRALTGLSARAIAYLSCDAGTLARDVAAARQVGWELRSLRVFDAFPMTAHVECLALLQPGPNHPADPATDTPAP